MSDLHQAAVVVVGAGAFGLAAAVTAARAGARVTVVSAPAPPASAIAAGMLAPAFEAVLDPPMAGRFELLRTARDRWPGFAQELPDIGLAPCGAVMSGLAEVLDAMAARLREAGAAVEATPDQIFTPDDWRLDASLALAVLGNEVLRLGGRIIPGRVSDAGPRLVRLQGGQTIQADAVILATGYSGLELAPELSCLSPVKGQLLRFSGHGPTSGPIRRGDGYLTPHPGGAIVGATMEPGKSELTPDAAATARLLAQAENLAPGLGKATPQVMVGVRPASPDGLPLVGRSANGVWLANGARRNGWLFAPLAARLLCEQIAGAPGDARFAPSRFTRPGGIPPAH